MARALSLEIRETIIDAYKRKQGTISNLASIFNVGTRVIDKLLHLNRNKLSLAPGKSTGRPSKIMSEHEVIIKKMVKDFPDKTLQEYCNYFFEMTGIQVGTSIMDREFKQLDIKRKKKSYYAAEQDRPDVKKKTGFYRRSVR